MAVDWCRLPVDILGLILQKLPLPDYIRVGGVCVSWNSVVRSRDYRPRDQPPWLMIPDDDDETRARFFSLSEKRTYTIRLPDPPIRRRLWIGSGHGWIITMDEECEMHLLNPITASQLHLPSITTLPFVDAVRDPHDGHLVKFNLLYDVRSAVHGGDKDKDHIAEFSPDDLRCFFSLKAVLSSPPPTESGDGSGDFIIMLLHNPDQRLAFMRAGDKAWTPLRTPTYFRDIILCGRSFYTLTLDADIYAWDIQDVGGFTDIQCHCDPLKSGGYSFKPRLIAQGKYDEGCSSYLINSLGGELAIVHRDYMEDGKGGILTDYIKRRVRSRGANKWRIVRDMADNVLFVGNNHSMSISSAKFPELTRNSIYFTDNYIEYSQISRHRPRNIGIYDFTHKCFKRLDSLPSHLTWPPSIWFTPIR